MDAVDLAIRMTADASDAAAAFDEVGAAAIDMSNDVERASDQADAATRSLADGVDGLGSSSSQAAGGLGDLGGALSLMPGPLGAVGSGMESLSPAIMGVTGASDLAKLAMESSIVTNTKARVSAVAHAVATRAQAAASKVAAAGQWALNAAMSANPIGIVIAAVLILVGLFVLAYKRSETFRAVVDTAMSAARTAIGWVVDKVQALVDKVADKAEPVFSGLSAAAETAGELAAAGIDLILTPVNALIDAVQLLIDWLGKIDVPDIDIPLVGRGSSGSVLSRAVPGGSVSADGGVTLIALEVNNGIVGNTTAMGRDLLRVLRQAGVSIGDTVTG